MKTRWLILLGLLVFLYALLFHAPVASLYAWLQPKNAPPRVELYGLEGSLSQGRAAGIVANGRPALTDLSWHLRPLWLLLGRADFALSGGGIDALLEGGVSVLPSGGINLHDLRYSGALKPLLIAAGQAFVPMDGRVGLNVSQLKLRNGLPTTAEGTLNLQGLSWTLAKDPLLLGDFQAVVAPKPEGLVATISTLAGPLDASGEATLAQDRSYDLHLQVKAKAGANPMIVNLLRSLGQPDTQGYYHLRRRGSLAAAVAAEPAP